MTVMTICVHNMVSGMFSISIDSDGRRVVYSDAHLRPVTGPVILLVLYSFVQETGIDDEDSFASVRARATPHNYLNLGVAGFGTDHELVKIEKSLIGACYRSAIVVLVPSLRYEVFTLIPAKSLIHAISVIALLFAALKKVVERSDDFRRTPGRS